MTNKKLTKKVVKWEKKHPNLTACCVYVTGASLAIRTISTIASCVTTAKTLKNVRKAADEVITEFTKDDKNVVDVEVNKN